MEKLFLNLLEMSLIGSYVILAVLLTRVFLQKSPKIFSYVLWSVVFFRLLCPVTLESPVSILPEPTKTMDLSRFSEFSPLEQEKTSENTSISPESPSLPLTEMPVTENVETTVVGSESLSMLQISLVIWLCGVVSTSIFSLFSLLKLKNRLKSAVYFEKNIYFTDTTDSPFVFGLWNPKIYLPAQVTEMELSYIIAHEQEHIRRFDHFTRLISHLALMLHWFNPLVWLAYYSSEKDMEQSCDEAVLKEKSVKVRGAYARTLLKFSGDANFMTPLAFSESNTKGRVKNIMKMKKTKLWVSGLTGFLVVCLIVGFATNRENAQYDTEFASFTIDSFLKSVYLKENSPELKKAQEEGLLPYYAFFPEHGSMYMTYELLPDKLKGTVTAENFKELQISENVNELSTELFSLYYPHIEYSIKNSVVGDTKEIEPVNYEYQGVQEGTVTVGTVDLEISPIDVLQGSSRDELDEIFTNLSTTYDDEVELRNAYLTEVLTMLLKNFSKVEYKKPVNYEANIAFYKIEKHQEYAMIDGRDGEYHFTKLLYTLFDFQGKY